MKADPDKSKVIDTIGGHVGGKSRTAQTRPTLFASSSRRRQHLPTPPRQKLRGSNGSSCFGCARNELRMIDRSRRTMQSSQYKPNDSARVGAGRSVLRGRVLSQSLLVARERRRRELGSNLVIAPPVLPPVRVMSWKLAFHDACGRIWLVLRHPLPSEIRSWRYPLREASASIGLLVTDQFVTTIYAASAEFRRRRKSKIVHATRPG